MRKRKWNALLWYDQKYAMIRTPIVPPFVKIVDLLNVMLLQAYVTKARLTFLRLLYIIIVIIGLNAFLSYIYYNFGYKNNYLSYYRLKCIFGL